MSDISRRHCRLLSVAGQWRVIDLNSANGVYVNGERVQTGVDVKLSSGDRLRFGLVETVFEIQ